MTRPPIDRAYPCHPNNYQVSRTAQVRYLVVHYVGALGGARENAKYYSTTPGIQASAHYFVGHAREGAAICASVAETDTAWHCGRSDGNYRHPACRNANSIGIELCCHQDRAGNWYFDKETVDQAIDLVRDLMDRYNIDTSCVLRHYDVTGKCCPAPYVKDEAAWSAFLARLEIQKNPSEMYAFYDRMNPLYTSLDQVPDYWREETRRLVEAGVIQGDGKNPLSIRREALQAMAVMVRYLQKM